MKSQERTELVANAPQEKPADTRERPEWGTAAWQKDLLDALSESFGIAVGGIQEKGSTTNTGAQCACAMITVRSIPRTRSTYREKDSQAIPHVVAEMLLIDPKRVNRLITKANEMFGSDDDFTKKARRVAERMGVLLRG